VRIAILDSGINLSPIQKEIFDENSDIKYRSWIGDSAVWEDEVGHGTHLATLLRRIAPNAMIHVARVFHKKPTIKSSAQIIADVKTHEFSEWFQTDTL
jgi:hypothetical protein